MAMSVRTLRESRDGRRRHEKSGECRAQQARWATSADSKRGASGEGPAGALRRLHVMQTEDTRGADVPVIVLSLRRSRAASCDECEAWCCESTSLLVARGEFEIG